MNEVFISYSRNDSQFVDGLIADLEQRGIHVWVDREDIEGGTAWRAAISAAIRQCRAFLIVLSPHSTQSRNVSRELSLAESHGRVIIPIIYQDCQIPPGMEYQLAELQWVNLKTLSYEEALERLVRALPKADEAASAVSAQQIERRRNDTARLRQILEAAAAAAPAATAPPPAPVSPRPSATPSAAPPTPSAQPFAKRLGVRSALLAVACAVLLGGGAYALYRGSSAEPTAIAQVPPPVASPTNAPAQSSLPTPPPASAQTPLRAAKPAAAPATPTATVAPAPPQPVAPDSPANLVIATKRFNSYFPPNCAARAGVKDQFRVEFKSEAEAKAQGYHLDVRCYPPENSVPVRGNTKSLLYHFPHCQGYNQVPAELRIEFKSQAEAKAAGYKINPNCH